MTLSIDVKRPTIDAYYSDKSRGLPENFQVGSGVWKFDQNIKRDDLLKEGYSLGREYDIYSDEAGSSIVFGETEAQSKVDFLNNFYGKGSWKLLKVVSTTTGEKGYQVVFK